MSQSEKPKRKQQVAQSGPPSPPKEHRPTDEERFEEYAESRSTKSEAIQQLIEAARGVGLILSSHREPMDENLAWNLGILLQSVVGPVDAYYFGSLGELNASIYDDHLAVLLERELKKVRAKIAKDRRRP